MEVSGTGKSPNTSLSFRYNANNEELEEIYDVCEDDPPTPQFDASPSVRSENASPKRGESSSILDKYFRSMRTEKPLDKLEDAKPVETKTSEESHGSSKEVTSSPKKDYLNRLGKRSVSEVPPEVKEPNDTWRLFHDLKFKITQAVDMKSRSLEETKEKSVPRENSISDSEENSVVKDFDLSVGDTDNQVSSLNSSIQNLSDMTQPLTAKASECETPPLENRNNSDSSDDTHKNIIHSYTADITKDYNGSHAMEVESGVEALEDGIDGFADVSNTDNDLQNSKPVEAVPTPPPPSHPPTDCGLPPNKNNIQRSQEKNSKDYFLNFTMYFLSFLLFVNYLLFPNWNIWNGFLMGIWFFCFISNLKQWFLDNYFSETEPFKRSYVELGRSSSLPMNTIPSVREYKPLKKYEGWVNHYRFSDYDPHTYHINKTTTSFMKLEGCNLRISYTRSKIGKRALWDEKIEKVMFYQHRLYNLTGARLILLPKGLVKRRQWSKKYPICIILSEKEKIQVLEKEISAADKKAAEGLTEKKREQMHEMESAETNTSPEKKKKFVWRRREKSISHSDGESGKEGLRHRLVRKMHRDKKTDSVSTCTEPPESQVDKNLQFEDAPFHDAEMEITAVRPSVTSTRDDGEEDLDETELSKIKEFLEETELDTAVDGTSEGEWSLHVKHSKDNHSRLYLFTRTGRDKHEWYRRLNSAILEANATASAEAAKPTTSDDKSTTDTQQHQQECKEGVEMTVYKLSEKDTVAFAKNTTKPIDALLEGLSDRTPLYAYFQDQNYEKTFWPYLFKVIQIHEMMYKQTCEVGVMCEIEPSPLGRSKSKKKRKDSKNAPSTCECRKLPAEVTWVNTVLARIIYDVTRNTDMIARLQNRIQRKLHTLKLPSFMSPLMVTELSLAGACPLVERVSAPTWDERGVWLDADMRYDGGAYITILTQINLMKLKEKNISLEDQLRNTNENIFDPDTNATEPGIIHSDRVLMQKKTAAYDSDVEDSAESSSDDESPPLQPVDSNDRVPQSEISAYSMDTQGSSSKKKFLRMVDKIATNKYFQQVTDYKYVKRAMEGLSNTDIKLQLEVHGIEGRLALNLPPPPHDRIWIGFRTNPQLVLKARPAVGARTLRFAHISNWIEQKLTKEFEKVMVLPNMEDIIVEVMTPTQVEYE